MPIKKAKKGGRTNKKVIEPEDVSDNLPDDDDIMMDQGAMQGNDIEDIDEDEKAKVHIKRLCTKNPQAPDNIVKFNYKERAFKREDQVDQVVWHYSVDGNILAKDSDEAQQQEENMDDKKLRD